MEDDSEDDWTEVDFVEEEIADNVDISGENGNEENVSRNCK